MINCQCERTVYILEADSIDSYAFATRGKLSTEKENYLLNEFVRREYFQATEQNTNQRRNSWVLFHNPMYWTLWKRKTRKRNQTLVTALRGKTKSVQASNKSIDRSADYRIRIALAVREIWKNNLSRTSTY